MQTYDHTNKQLARQTLKQTNTCARKKHKQTNIKTHKKRSTQKQTNTDNSALHKQTYKHRNTEIQIHKHRRKKIHKQQKHKHEKLIILQANK